MTSKSSTTKTARRSLRRIVLRCDWLTTKGGRGVKTCRNKVTQKAIGAGLHYCTLHGNIMSQENQLMTDLPAQNAQVELPR